MLLAVGLQGWGLPKGVLLFVTHFPHHDHIEERGVAHDVGRDRAELAQLGVPAGQIAVSDACTMCRPDVFWSHRATNGRRGVQAAVITL